MDIQKFINQLPSCYENWGKDTVIPKSKEFSSALTQVKGMTTPNVMQLLNLAVQCLENDEIYCEIGCFQGSTLIGALLNNPDKMAYAVDNFSEFDPENKNFNQLIANLTKFNLQEQVFFCNQNFEEFFADLKSLQPDLKIGVYFYDGAHDYRSQLLGLLLARPFLAPQALIIIDDTNWTMAQQANYDFINSFSECSLLIDLPTPQDGYRTFWNGITVLTYNINQQLNLAWQEIENNYRNPLAIKLIYDLHFNLEFQQKPQVINSLIAEALELHNQEKFEEAIAKFQQALIWHKYNPSIYNNMASMYAKLEQYEKALEYAQIAVNLDSKIELHQLNLKNILAQIGRK